LDIYAVLCAISAPNVDVPAAVASSQRSAGKREALPDELPMSSTCLRQAAFEP
jgi:hypothetical protein